MRLFYIAQPNLALLEDEEQAVCGPPANQPIPPTLVLTYLDILFGSREEIQRNGEQLRG